MASPLSINLNVNYSTKELFIPDPPLVFISDKNVQILNTFYLSN